jgi:hypothetical protein
LVEQFDPPHPVVTAALGEFRAAAVEEQQRREQEVADRQAEQERVERERRAREELGRAQSEIDAGRFDEALKRLADLRAMAGQMPGLEQLIDKARSARDADAAARQAALAEAQRQDEERRQEAEAQRLERQRLDVGDLLSEAPTDLEKPEHGRQHGLAGPARRDERIGSQTSTGKRWGAVAAALLAAAAAIGLLVRNLPVGDVRDQVTPAAGLSTVPPTALSTIPPTAVTPQTSTPTSTPSPLPPPPTETDASRSLASAKILLNSGNLTGAAQLLAAALARSPGDRALDDQLRQIVRAAQARGDQARRDADRAGASSTPEYAEAMTHLRTGGRPDRTGRLDVSVSEFLKAENLFAEAVKSSTKAPTVAAVTTSVPVVALATVPPVTATTTPPMAQTSMPTTSVATTSIVPTISAAAARELLERYSAEYRKLDVTALRSVFPSLGENMVRRIEQQKKNFTACVYTFSNTTVLPGGTANSALVEADAVEQCTAKIRRAVPADTTRPVFSVGRTPGGDWVITSVRF